MTFREMIDRGLDTPVQEIAVPLVQAGLVLFGLLAVVAVLYIVIPMVFWAYKRRRYDHVRSRSQPRIRR